jgi:hypothetical protein
MAKLRYFKFYYFYKQAFQELSGRRCKKLLLALLEYSENGAVSKLDKKTTAYFLKIKELIDADRLLATQNGYKGGKKRWQNERLREGNRGSNVQNNQSYQKHRGAIVVKRSILEGSSENE